MIVPPSHQREVAVFPREEEVGVVHLDAFQADVEALSGYTLHIITPGWRGHSSANIFPFASRLLEFLLDNPSRWLFVNG